MMKKIILLMLVLLISSCAKKGITPAKVKLNVAALMDTRTGIGSGGAILFGKASSGETFAQVVATNEENVELANGTWSFYALMWDNPSAKFSGNVYCAKPSTQTLSGTDATVSLNLTNADCTDSAYSNAGLYTDANSKIRFSDVYLEECDEIKATTTHTCGVGNRGSARSYKVVFNSYKKTIAGVWSFGSGEIASSCIKADRTSGIIHNALPINIPNGSASLSIPIAIKMYLGSDACSDSDAKGSVVVNLDQGVGAKSQNGQIVAYNPNNCAINPSALTGTNPGEVKEKCEDLMGHMSGYYCDSASIPDSITRFAPAAICVTPSLSTTQATGANATAALSAVYPAVKHLVAIPKDNLCAKYLGQSTMIGTNPFAGGDGTEDRPFKICNEWQINQIGEPNAPAAFSISHYKLMNDLDMNLVDIGGKTSTTAVYTKPACAYAGNATTPGDLDNYHNFNPLDKIVDIHCAAILATSQNFTGFSGVFNGNGKSINNARIFGRNVDTVGFVRKLASNAVIKDLNFNFLFSQGASNVGGVAGVMDGPSSNIKNIKIDHANISADNHNQNSGSSNTNTNIMVGAVAGKASSLTFIENVQVTNSSVRGGDYVAGIVGETAGKISKSSYRGSIRQNGNYGGNAAGITAHLLSTGSIEYSFSEGTLEADTRHMGGIAGYLQGGFVSHAYSNMSLYLKNNYATNGIDYYVGGLFGYSDNGTVSDVYFGGLVNIQHYPKSNTTYYGIIGGQYGSFNISNCATSEAVSSDVGCTTLLNTQLRSGAVTQLTQAGFVQEAGRLPHFSWESNPCLSAVSVRSVADQATAGRGSVDNPIVICNSMQLTAISGRSSSEHYLLGDDISLKDWTSNNLITTLNGKLHGNGRSLYDLNITLTQAQGYTSTNFSIIGTLETTGQIDNINLTQMKLDSSYATNLAYAGLLTSLNKGLIVNVNASDISLNSSAPTMGMIAAINFGSILQTTINRSDLLARSVGGTVAGVASPTSIISKADVDGKVSLNTPSGPTPNLGGVIGKNEGSVDQVRYHGEVSSLYSQSFTTNSNQGGIAGLNSGSISNALVEFGSNLYFNKINYVGGIAGSNLGTISKTIALGKVISTDTSFSSTHIFAPILAYSGANAVMNDSFHLENMIGTLLGSPTPSDIGVGSLSTFGSPQTCDNPIAITTQANMSTYSYLISTSNIKADLFSFNGNNNSSQLSTLIPITGLVSGMNGMYIFKYLPPFTYNNQQCVPGNSQLDFYKKPILDSMYTVGHLSPANMGLLSSFSNFNIAGKDSSGNRVKEVEMIGFFKSIMYGQAAPANAPIWQLDGDSSPSLIQINPFN